MAVRAGILMFDLEDGAPHCPPRFPDLIMHGIRNCLCFAEDTFSNSLPMIIGECRSAHKVNMLIFIIQLFTI